MFLATGSFLQVSGTDRFAHCEAGLKSHQKSSGYLHNWSAIHKGCILPYSWIHRLYAYEISWILPVFPSKVCIATSWVIIAGWKREFFFLVYSCLFPPYHESKMCMIFSSMVFFLVLMDNNEASKEIYYLKGFCSHTKQITPNIIPTPSFLGVLNQLSNSQ